VVGGDASLLQNVLGLHGLALVDLPYCVKETPVAIIHFMRQKDGSVGYVAWTSHVALITTHPLVAPQ